MAGRIGIVTPYKDQQRCLRREIAFRFGHSVLSAIEISTVVISLERSKDSNSNNVFRTDFKAKRGKLLFFLVYERGKVKLVLDF